MELHPLKEQWTRIDEAFEAEEGKIDSMAAAGSGGTTASDQNEAAHRGTVQGDAMVALDSKIRSLDSHVQSLAPRKHKHMCFRQTRPTPSVCHHSANTRCLPVQ